MSHFEPFLENFFFRNRSRGGSLTRKGGGSLTCKGGRVRIELLKNGRVFHRVDQNRMARKGGGSLTRTGGGGRYIEIPVKVLIALVFRPAACFVGRAPNSAGGSGAVDPTAPRGALSTRGTFFFFPFCLKSEKIRTAIRRRESDQKW